MSLKVAVAFVIFVVCKCSINRHLLESDKPTGNSEWLMKYIKSVPKMVKQNQLPLNDSNYLIDSFNGLISQFVITEFSSGECWVLKASEEQRAYDIFEGVINATYVVHMHIDSDWIDVTRNVNLTTGDTYSYYMREVHLCAVTNATIAYVPTQLFKGYDRLRTKLLAYIRFYSNVVNTTASQTTP